MRCARAGPRPCGRRELIIDQVVYHQLNLADRVTGRIYICFESGQLKWIDSLGVAAPHYHAKCSIVPRKGLVL
jgi:hypothetical protein